jgi:hypothetical protein
MRFLWLRFRIWWAFRTLRPKLDALQDAFNRHSHPISSGPTEPPRN